MTSRSILSRLRWLIIGLMLLILVPLGIFSFRKTLNEIDELSDGRLAQAARTLDVLVQHVGIAALARGSDEHLSVPINAVRNNALTVQGHTYESEVGYQVFDAHGSTILATENMAALPPPAGAGDAETFHDVQAGRHLWRVYMLTDTDAGVTIRVGERYDSRHDITHALWIEHGLPPLLLLPLLALLIGWAVRRGLRPLETLTNALSAREPGSRELIVLDDAPREIAPVVNALNTQIASIENALERERRFSADVAHELRTPLASTMINLENAMALAKGAEADLAIRSAHECLESLARRTEQLLALARLESGAAAGPRVALDMVDVVRDTLDDITPLIATGHVELSVTSLPDHVPLVGYGAALGAMLRNLLENALRHVPAGGHVGLSVTQDADTVTLEVVDDGPGIAPERREHVFTRFHREPGSGGDGLGLGLSIVQRAAWFHGATIELLDSPHGQGLRVRVRIPKSAHAG
ncbi:two-component system sensor histidine kinase QseC [Luteibacter sp. Sphag1AF]|uniref:sensor histidine kinase n=1 Tax=Luteibacter sp. Sphag1AF TaxID=2587031 RepID=UPI00161BD65B|nr:ATP-binding protein [Luteibacter sp. Sphag1AF]MBB3226492.1 two-component system sensor histidine kinase QseC [Luteibacter sp. Sphag1AF]